MNTRNYSRFIPGEEIAAVEQWQFGAIDTAAQLLAAQVKAREAQAQQAQQESERQAAFNEGFSAGLVQGRQQALAEAQRQIQDFKDKQAQEAAAGFAAVFESAKQELQASEQSMAQGVLTLACEVARQVLRRELSVNPDVLMPVVREAIGLLGAECKTAVVKLHPQDLAQWGEQIHADFADLGLSLRPDPELLPGGCLVESAGTVVDGTLQKRWQKTVAKLGLESVWSPKDERG